MWGAAEDLERELAEGGVYRVSHLVPDKKARRCGGCEGAGGRGKGVASWTV